MLTKKKEKIVGNSYNNFQKIGMNLKNTEKELSKTREF